MQLFYKMNFFFHFTYIIDLKTKIKENSLLSMSMQSVLSSKCFFELTLFSRLHFCQNSSYLQIVQYAHGFVTQDYLFFIVFYSFVFEFGVWGLGFFIISESYIRQKYLMQVILYKCWFFLKKLMVYIINCLDKMSDSNDTLLAIYKFSSNIFWYPAVILNVGT